MPQQLEDEGGKARAAERFQPASRPVESRMNRCTLHRDDFAKWRLIAGNSVNRHPSWPDSPVSSASSQKPLFLRLGRLKGESEPIASKIVSRCGEGVRILRRVSTEYEW